MNIFTLNSDIDIENGTSASFQLVRVKLNRDDTMTKVKLFDPETMENEQDLKEVMQR